MSRQVVSKPEAAEQETDYKLNVMDFICTIALIWRGVLRREYNTLFRIVLFCFFLSRARH